jgi:hypothetical protein
MQPGAHNSPHLTGKVAAAFIIIPKSWNFYSECVLGSKNHTFFSHPLPHFLHTTDDILTVDLAAKRGRGIHFAGFLSLHSWSQLPADATLNLLLLLIGKILR